MADNRRSIADFLRQVQVEDWLSPAVDAVDEQAERWQAPAATIRPSACSTCPRDVQLDMLGHRSANGAQGRRRMDNGTGAHVRWVDRLARAGLLVADSQRLRELADGTSLLNLSPPAGTAVFWSGELDVVVRHPVTKLRYIVEVKTMNARRWGLVPAQDPDHARMARLLALRERRYVHQLTQYLVKLAPALGAEDTGIFILENTDTQQYKVRYMRPDGQLRLEAFRAALEARAHTLRGELVPPPYARRSAECRRCYQEAACYDLQDGVEPIVGEVQRRLQEVALRGG